MQKAPGKCSLLVLLFLSSLPVLGQADRQLQFDAPASHFTQSLPLGNGRLGAMVFGGTNKERIVLNEISMWSGGTEDPNRHDAHQYLSTIQQFLKEEKEKEAQDLLQKHFVAAGNGSGRGRGSNLKYGCYQTLGDLLIQWTDTAEAATDYRRVLEVDKALATTTWKRGGVVYSEEVFISAPQQVIVIRLRASKAKALSFILEMNRKERATVASAGNSISMNGQLYGGNNDSGVKFGAYLATRSDGIQTSVGNGSQIDKATECVIILSAATDLAWPNIEQRGPAPLPVSKQYVSKASKFTWNQLFGKHLADYKSYFDRCQLVFTPSSTDSASTLTTSDRLIRYFRGEQDVHRPALYFNFGRYLLISSSCPAGLPANLQGLWSEEYQTPWNGDYHLNINLQMNYWPAEKTNLADCHLPLIEFTKQLVTPGEKTAKAYYNSNGWVAHMMSNPWKFTAPGESAVWGSSLTGGAWLCQHLWQHYQYNPDKKYLKTVYPLLCKSISAIAAVAPKLPSI